MTLSTLRAPPRKPPAQAPAGDSHVATAAEIVRAAAIARGELDAEDPAIGDTAKRILEAGRRRRAEIP